MVRAEIEVRAGGELLWSGPIWGANHPTLGSVISHRPAELDGRRGHRRADRRHGDGRADRSDDDQRLERGRAGNDRHRRDPAAGRAVREAHGGRAGGRSDGDPGVRAADRPVPGGRRTRMRCRCRCHEQPTGRYPVVQDPDAVPVSERPTGEFPAVTDPSMAPTMPPDMPAPAPGARGRAGARRPRRWWSRRSRSTATPQRCSATCPSSSRRRVAAARGDVRRSPPEPRRGGPAAALGRRLPRLPRADRVPAEPGGARLPVQGARRRQQHRGDPVAGRRDRGGRRRLDPRQPHPERPAPGRRHRHRPAVGDVVQRGHDPHAARQLRSGLRPAPALPQLRPSAGST